MGKRPVNKMPPEQRAKQFLPFAAVTGLEEALRRKEIELQKQERPQLAEEEAEQVNSKLSQLRKNDTIALTFYRAGTVRTEQGIASGIDRIRRQLLFRGEEIPLEDILGIERL